MEKICVMLLNKEEEQFQFYKEIELSRIPVRGDKFLISSETEGKSNTSVYEVVDVHFADGTIPDILMVNRGKREHYLNNLVLMV